MHHRAILSTTTPLSADLNCADVSEAFIGARAEESSLTAWRGMFMSRALERGVTDLFYVFIPENRVSVCELSRDVLEGGEEQYCWTKGGHDFMILQTYQL